MDNSRLFDIFLDIQAGLPRQGPGDATSTLRAWALCEGLPERPRILDVGCGPGMQTLVLARLLRKQGGGQVTAVDLVPAFLDQLRARLAAEGLEDLVEPLMADMRDLPFGDESFDLLWSEGAAYSMGFGEALGSWRRLLAPRGHLAVSELCWTRPQPPEEAVAFWREEYPAMTDRAGVLARVRAAGYDVVADFVLPEACWWDDYYTPLEAKLPGLRKKYAADAEAQALVESTAREIAMRREHGDSYGYLFVVARKGAR